MFILIKRMDLQSIRWRWGRHHWYWWTDKNRDRSLQHERWEPRPGGHPRLCHRADGDHWRGRERGNYSGRVHTKWNEEWLHQKSHGILWPGWPQRSIQTIIVRRKTWWIRPPGIRRRLWLNRMNIKCNKYVLRSCFSSCSLSTWALISSCCIASRTLLYLTLSDLKDQTLDITVRLAPSPAQV